MLMTVVTDITPTLGGVEKTAVPLAARRFRFGGGYAAPVDLITASLRRRPSGSSLKALGEERMQRKPEAGATVPAHFRRERDWSADGIPDADADAADVAYARRVLDDPETQWIDWDDAKRKLANEDD